MSKDFLLQYAQGKEVEPEAPLPIRCYYEFDEVTREVKIVSCETLNKCAPNFFFLILPPGKNPDEELSKPTDEEVNRAINAYLNNETPVRYKNSNKKSRPDMCIQVFDSGVPVFNSEEEIDEYEERNKDRTL